MPHPGLALKMRSRSSEKMTADRKHSWQLERMLGKRTQCRNYGWRSTGPSTRLTWTNLQVLDKIPNTKVHPAVNKLHCLKKFLLLLLFWFAPAAQPHQAAQHTASKGRCQVDAFRRLQWAHHTLAGTLGLGGTGEGRQHICLRQVEVMLDWGVQLGRKQCYPLSLLNSRGSQPQTDECSESGAGGTGWSQGTQGTLLSTAHLSLRMYAHALECTRNKETPSSLLSQKHEDNCRTTEQQCHSHLLIPPLTFT